MLNGLQSINWQLLQEIDAPARHNPLLDQVMIFGAQDVIFLLPLLLVLLWVGVVRWTVAARATGGAAASATARIRSLGLQLLLLAVPAVLLAIILTLLAGALVNEPRPFASHPSLKPLIYHAADASFPSDHAAVAAAMVTMLMVYAALLLWQARPRGPQLDADQAASARTLTGLLKLAVAVAVVGVLGVLFLGYARVYVGVHYPGDIAGGIIIGAISGLLVTWIRPLAAPILTEFIATAERLHLA